MGCWRQVFLGVCSWLSLLAAPLLLVHLMLWFAGRALRRLSVSANTVCQL